MAGLGTGLAASFAANKLKYIIGGVIIVLFGIAITVAIKEHYKQERFQDNEFTQKGVLQERAQSQSETINAVQNATQAVRAPTPEQLNVVCNKYDRNCTHRP